jgi:hypothetical protein
MTSGSDPAERSVPRTGPSGEYDVNDRHRRIAAVAR